MKNIILPYKQLKDSVPPFEGLPFRMRDAMLKGINKMIIGSYFGKFTKTAIRIWEGVSNFDEEPIQIVLECYASDSTNLKTGPMIQLSILPLEKDAHKVYKAKEETVCGSCKYKGGGCYVRWYSLKTAQKNSKINIGNLELGKALLYGMRVRVGKAGDPAAVPVEVWRSLLSETDGFTGYTHAWETCNQELKNMFMASCDSFSETKKALSMGWKPFHVYDVSKEGKKERIHKESVQCSFRELDATDLFKGHVQVSCFNCMRCNGYDKRKRTPITVQLHGATNTVSAARKARGVK